METAAREHTFHKYSPMYGGIDSVSVVHERGRGIAWRIWPGAHVLMDWLEANRDKWCKAPCHCVEIGAGVGLVGVACAGLGADQVTLTDLPEELEALERSKSSNHETIKKRIGVMPLRFGVNDDIDIVARVGREGSQLVVLGSELIYWESLFEPIAQTLARFIHSHKAVAYIGYRIRVWKTEKRFFTKILQKHGLDCEVVGQWYALEEDSSSQLTDGHIVYKEDAGNEWNTRVYKIFRNTSHHAPKVDLCEPKMIENQENMQPRQKVEKRKPKKIVKLEKKGRSR